MTTPTRNKPADPLASLLTLGVLGERSDARLLELYRTGSPGADGAFRALLERHGPMVHSVCRGVVRDRDEADDAFQAVFLVLIRRAVAIRKGDSLGPWLHGVALRVAKRANRRSTDRRNRLSLVDPATLAAREAPPEDATALIHAEIDRLPERYRGPIILCGLEGLSYEQAARALGVSEPALRGRLQRGRRRLESRLTPRGVIVPGPFVLAAPPAPVIQSLLALSTRTAAVPLSISSLAKGALVAMTLASWKPVAFSSLATLGVVGSVVLAQQAGPTKPTPQPSAAVPVSPPATPPTSEPEPIPGPPSREEREAKNAIIRAKLAERHDFDFPEGIELEKLLKWLKESSATPSDPGIPIYVNPYALSITDKHLRSTVDMKAKTVPIGVYLRDYLAVLDLGYAVKDGFLMIDTRAGAADLRVDAIEEKLDRLTRLIEERLPAVGDFELPKIAPRQLKER
ncbi:RNA polymerase sigma factor [Paludisphaera soli]|uniref:RNA polymerase sigma factor n=1 Tax=Paludisphaera soli TaxID=2712865 RepID=UPI0013EC62A9|nr:RNA polymerase sigma factor [Paludisphaera soli]